MKKFSFKGGIHIHGSAAKKALTTNSQIIIPKEPEYLYLPLNQQLGRPSVPVVAVGDEVKAGQIIAKKDGTFSANIHSPISGFVEHIDFLINEPTGQLSKSIVIKNNFSNQEVEYISRTTDEAMKLTSKNIVDIMEESGLVGLGGATFPTPVKYTGSKKCDAVILNGIECEPYNTADYAIMKNHCKEVIRGLKYMLLASGATKGYICIEDNKMDIYETFRQSLSGNTDIQVALFKEKYPQGAEKQLVSALLNKEVPYGGLPIDIGVIVNNVGTAKALCDAVELGKPLTHHYLTITGNIKSPSNYYVPIGILFKDLIDEEDFNKNNVLLAGGLMMGKTMYTEMTPVTKGINAIILLENLPKVGPELPCVRCSSCIDNCPAFLSPTNLAQLVKNNKFDSLDEYGIVACIECGTCSYVCPSHIPLLDYIRHGKLELRRR